MHHCCICCHEFIVSSPPSLSIDAETDAVAAEFDYTPDEQPTDDQPLLAELPGKKTPLTHAYIAYSFSLMLALEFATALV